jgi:hypothetical protein
VKVLIISYSFILILVLVLTELFCFVDGEGFLLKKVAMYITKMLRVFGLVDSTREFGFHVESTSIVNTQSREDILRPYLEAFNRYRNLIRQAINVRNISFARSTPPLFYFVYVPLVWFESTNSTIYCVRVDGMIYWPLNVNRTLCS